MAATDPREDVLPFSRRWPLIAGALVGVAVRALVFTDHAGSNRSAMVMYFVVGAPLAIGAVTVYLAERVRRRSWGYYARAGALANALAVLGTLLVAIEGLICAIVILPLFALYGAIAGLIMGAICRWTQWPRAASYCVVTLPVALALILPYSPPHDRYGSIERSLVVRSTPERIWPHLMTSERIRPAEVERGWLYRIGVPLPEAGVTRSEAEGLVRNVLMGRSIHFEQIATDWRANEYVHWRYRFARDSFPPGSLDDHVEIGGHYFDITDTVYTLQPIDAQTTRLGIRMNYRVSTDFNWYADGVARLLIGNFNEVILDFYRRRAEQGVAGA